MTLNDLIAKLEELRDNEDAGDYKVFLAQQPSWPFQYGLGKVVTVPEYGSYGKEGEDSGAVYIGEGKQLDYLSEEAREALNW